MEIAKYTIDCDIGNVRLLKLRPAGMFSNVNEVVEQARLAKAGGYRFSIDWSTSCYRDLERAEDPWAYYFEPCFSDLPASTPKQPVLPGGSQVACTRENIITPRLEDGNCNPLLLPRDRYGAHELIERHIIPKSHVHREVNMFYNVHFRAPMIGLHIRGPGRTDGGVPELRRRYGVGDSIPMEPFFKQTDEVLRLLPNAGIFTCSDSSAVIAAVQERYGDQVVIYPAQRSEFGEMHANHSANAGQNFDPYQLGMDVLSEALLLARTDVFIHGNSNVANFVLCAAPYLVHAYIQA